MVETPLELFTIFCDLARELNEWVPPERIRVASPALSAASGDRPGDEFNRRAAWSEILEPHGWTVERTAGDVTYWTRPGKVRGVSATTGKCRSDRSGDLLYVFTSNAGPFDQDSAYDKFGAEALLKHGGDFRKAAKAVAAAGYSVHAPSARVRAIGSSGDDLAGFLDFYPAPGVGEQWNDPHRAARLYAAKNKTEAGEHKLLQWRDEFHLWNGAAWRPLPDSELDADVMRHTRALFVADLPFRIDLAKKAYEAAQAEATKKKPFVPPTIFPVTTTVRQNVLANLSGLVNRRDDGTEPPFWIDCDEATDPASVVAAPNGLFTLDGIAADRGAFSAPTPRFFTANALPFDVPNCTPEPVTWMRALDEWFSGDADSISGLQEWIGYLLSADTSMHKALFLVGPIRSGKGTLIRVATALVGAANVVTTSFAALGESFGLEDMIGKRIAIIPDARLSGRTDVAGVVERIISISGEDAQTINRKNRKRVTSRLSVRFVLASNEIPRLPDASGALASRFHILNTPNSWFGREDRTLESRIMAELPSILKWAALGWVRLRDNGAFTANAAAEEHANLMADLSSPIRTFVREVCDVGPTKLVPKAELYTAWCQWNHENGARLDPKAEVFGRDLLAAIPHIKQSQPWIDGQKVRVYRGIGLRPAGQFLGAGPTLEQVGTCSKLAHALVEK